MILHKVYNEIEICVLWKGMMCVRECMWHDITCVYECFPTERENNLVYTVDRFVIYYADRKFLLLKTMRLL